MRIGLDFDNTIVCYDEAIAKLAEELFDLPAAVPRQKLPLRDYLRREGREPEWTTFQGELYGPGMRYAQPFEGALETMLHLVAMGHQLVIVSHRSARPYAGPPHDLHVAARKWISQRLQIHGLFSDGAVHFLETRDAKVAMISQLMCDIFVDDLPEVLDAPEFPARTRGIWFAPASDPEVRRGENHSVGKVSRTLQLTLSAWTDLPTLISKPA